MGCSCMDAIGCDCVITSGYGISVTGSGTPGSPYLVTNTISPVLVADTPSLDLTKSGNTISGKVNLTPLLSVADTSTVDLTLGGLGTEASPFVLSGAIKGMTLTGGNTGDVLTKQLDGSWRPGPPTQAPLGSVVVGPGLRGSGSGAAPLRVYPGTYAEWEALTL